MRTGVLRDVSAAIGAVAVCLACLAVGTWIFLQLSGAGDEFRALQQAPAGSPTLEGIDLEVMMARWSLPVMLGVSGGAALCTGLVAGFFSRRRTLVGIVLVGIVPLYVIAFATGLRGSNLLWATLYTIVAVGAAYAVEGMRRPRGVRF